MSVPVRRALYGKMAGDTTLTNLLHGSPPAGYTKAIYYQQAPKGAGYPYVIFQKQAGTPRYAFANRAFDNDVWLMKGVDGNPTADGVDAISSRLDALLTDAVLTISGRTPLYLRRESDVVYSETVDGVLIRHSGSLYRFIYV